MCGSRPLVLLMNIFCNYLIPNLVAVCLLAALTIFRCFGTFLTFIGVHDRRDQEADTGGDEAVVEPVGPVAGP